MTNERSRYFGHFTQDLTGLTKMIAWHLDWSQTKEVKLRDITVAKRLEITLDRLHELQSELRNSGVYFCRRNQTSTRYGIYPTLDEIVSETW